jgi:hypothetical protein
MKMTAWRLLVLGGISCLVSWTYMHRILLPWEYYGNVSHGRLKAQMGDLYPRWVGTRELLLNHRNPYGPEVSHEIQMAFYGHTIEQNYAPGSDIIDEQRFVYPVYAVFLLAPTVHADFDSVQAWAPAVLGAMIALSALLWPAALRWQLSASAAIAMALIGLSTPQIAQGLRLRQLGFLVFFLLTLASFCVTRNRLFTAGVLLAVATIKPQMTALCLVWFLMWAVGDWKKRGTLIVGFSAALAILIGGGELFLPGWPSDFLEGLQAYRKYFPTTSPVRLILGNWIGGTLSLVALAILLIYAWHKRKVVTDSPEFLEMLALFFLTSTLILPLLTPYNQVLLLLPVLLLLRRWETIPKFGRLTFVTLFAWPLVTSVALLFYRPNVNSLHRTPLLPSAAVLVTPFLICWLTFARRARLLQVSVH